MNEEDYLLSDKEIVERAKDIINISKDNNKEAVISVFEKISVPFSGKNYKKKIFLKIFELANIDGVWDEKLGIIIFSERRTVKTIVSHMDLIPSFNKGFKKNKIYKIENEKIIGALDNTFTNAILISQILNDRHNNVNYLFTKDEETTQNAIKTYMKKYGSNQFIINMDVTNDGLNHNMSIEYDEPCWNICKQLEIGLKRPFFTKERVGDDLDGVLIANGYGFSYCIPTENKIHSYKNSTELSKIEPYMNGLSFLIHELDTTIMTQDIDFLSIEKALKHKTLKDMKENDLYVLKDSKKVNNNKHKNMDNIFLTDTTAQKEYKQFIKVLYRIVSIKYPGYKKNLDKFLDYMLGMADTFRLDELKLFLPKDFYYELLSMRLLRQSGYSYNEFELNIVKTTEFKILLTLLKYKNINSLELYKLIIEDNINEFTFDEFLFLEKDKRVQNTSESIIDLLKKGLIKKDKNNDIFIIQ